jgi:hypothetical protein
MSSQYLTKIRDIRPVDQNIKNSLRNTRGLSQANILLSFASLFLDRTEQQVKSDEWRNSDDRHQSAAGTLEAGVKRDEEERKRNT